MAYTQTREVISINKQDADTVRLGLRLVVEGESLVQHPLPGDVIYIDVPTIDERPTGTRYLVTATEEVL